MDKKKNIKEDKADLEKDFRQEGRIKLKFDKSDREYDEDTIKEILEYQQKHNLRNSEMMKQFNLSRTTLLMWQRYFSE